MQEVIRALQDVRQLYQKVVGRPVPDMEPGSYFPFPPGVDPLKHAVEEVRHLMKFSEEMAASPKPVAWVPRADSFATDDGFMMTRLEVPGIAREDVKVSISGGELIVRGERKRPGLDTEMRPLAIERQWGVFERRFVLPAGCPVDRVKARYAQGVLELRFPVEINAPAAEMAVEVA